MVGIATFQTVGPGLICSQGEEVAWPSKAAVAELGGSNHPAGKSEEFFATQQPLCGSVAKQSKALDSGSSCCDSEVVRGVTG